MRKKGVGNLRSPSAPSPTKLTDYGLTRKWAGKA